MQLTKILHGELPLQSRGGVLKEIHGGSGEDDVIDVEQRVHLVGAVVVDEQ
jgi:hypothetical protein